MGQFIDITGNKYNRLTVLSREPNNRHGHTMWRCECDCGNTVVTSGQQLKSGLAKSCGCARIKDLTGGVFGMLTVSRFSHMSKGNAWWVCTCECGNERTARTGYIQSGQMFSCGCVTRDGRVLHGLSKHPLYDTYAAMRKRCENPKDRAFPDYGGRGITVCDRWVNGSGGLTGFQCYFEDLGDRPEGMSLDRVDPDRGYSPDNCRWANSSIQSNNKRFAASNRMIEALLSAIDNTVLQGGSAESLAALKMARGVFNDGRRKPRQGDDEPGWVVIAANDNGKPEEKRDAAA